MTTAELILKQTIADESQLLEQMKTGSHRPSCITDEQHATCIRDTENSIAQMQAVLAGGNSAIADWWNAIPEDTRHGLINA